MVTAPAATAASALPENATPSAQFPASLEEAQSRYLALKSQLDAALVKKRAIDRTLSDLESQIWLFEGSYFQTTAASGGNIIKGFDNYLKASQTTGRGAAAAQLALENGEIPPEDRVFSASSLTYQRSLELKAAEEMTKQSSANKEKSKAVSGSNKKEKHSKDKDKEKDRDKDKDRDKEKEKEKDDGEITGKGKDKDKEISIALKETIKEKKEKKRRREE